MSFSLAQTFYLDPDVVKKSAEVGLTRIDLYFRAKPKATNNKSGILEPGVEVSIVECINGIPNISEVSTIRPPEPTEHGARFSPRYEVARKEWGEIQVSTDASVATIFKFKNPIQLKTGYEYAILVKFDGNEDFILWYSKQGDPLIGSNAISPGPSGKYIGNFFTYISPTNLEHNPSTSPSANTDSYNSALSVPTGPAPPDTTPDMEYLANNWSPLPNLDLKFSVYVARFMHNGVAVCSNVSIQNDLSLTGYSTDYLNVNCLANNIFLITSPQRCIEYFSVDLQDSIVDALDFGEAVYQEQPYWPGGTANPLTISVSYNSTSVIANSSYSTWKLGNISFNANGGWNKIFSLTQKNPEFIIIKSGTNVAIRKIAGILSNTELIVNEPITFTNTAANFFVSPVGYVWGSDKTYFHNEITGFLSLVDSNANSSVRFTDHRIESISVTANGSGYSNTDYMTINGYEYVLGAKEGGYPAYANIVTNALGNIVSVYVSNTGCNFTNTSWIAGANVSISNSSNLPTSGTGATFTYNIGSTLRTEFNSNNIFANSEVVNIEVSRVKPEITINNPLGTGFTIKHRSQYYEDYSANTQSQIQYRIRSNPEITDATVKIFKSCPFTITSNTVLTSRSNEFIIRYANNVAANASVIGEKFSNSTVYLFEVSSNNDFIIPFLEPEIINAHYSRYMINNDYTDEHTNYGNAIAKHIGTKIFFSQDRTAEDILVYLTAYRPYGTDIKVFARIHNSKDPEAFDDKDWTLLDLIDGIGVYSSLEDSTDFIEYTYNFASNPNTSILTGTVRVNNTSPYTVNGVSTTFSSSPTANLQANDIVKIRSSIIGFAQTYLVGVVNSVISDTAITLQDAITNNSFYDTDLKIEKVLFKHQAFNNIQNDNVVRYYNGSTEEFDGYNTFQIKMVMLSNNHHIVPKIDDVRAIGVTA